MSDLEVEVLDTMPQALAVTDNPYLSMAQQALTLGKVEQLDKLLDLQFKWDNEQSRKAYLTAFAAFKASPLLVTKDKKNNQYNSWYTTIGNMVNTVSAAMAPHGLSADWEVDQSDPKFVTVTCILSHERGHSKRVTMSGPPDASGAKNDLQKIKSTVTYLKIATFEAVTGTASQEGNADDDGNGYAGKKPNRNDSNSGKPAAGAWESIDAATEAGLRKLAVEVKKLLNEGERDPIKAYERVQKDKLSSEEKIAFWTLLESNEKTALNKAADALKVMK